MVMGYDKQEYKKNMRHERKILLIGLLGGVCVECNTDNDLHFDHVFPEDKEFHISANLDYDLKKILVELQKCQLLCKPCHIIKTISDRGFNESQHGSVSTYTNKKCRCQECRAAWAVYASKYTKKFRAKKVLTPAI